MLTNCNHYNTIILLFSILSSKVLNDKLLLHKDLAVMFENNFGKNRHLITNLIKKNSGQKIKKKYCVELRQFAVTLNFYSPKA